MIKYLQNKAEIVDEAADGARDDGQYGKLLRYYFKAWLPEKTQWNDQNRVPQSCIYISSQ